MATPNYNLPTISGNMTADVVRDMNALATATDGAIKSAVSSIDLTKIDQVDSRLTAHLEETKTNAHKAKNITLEDVDGLFVGTELETAMKELFTNVSNGKELIGAAITDTDPSKIAPVNPTFQQLANLIRGISTGKKFSKGTINSDTAGKIIVSGLTFEPKMIFYWRSGNATSARSYNGMYVHFSEYNTGFNVNHSITGASYADNIFTINTSGFSAMTNYPQSGSYFYIALA